MTLEEANEIIDRVSKMWPFSRLTPEQVVEVEKAHKIVSGHQHSKLLSDTPEGLF